jgi:serine/threonine-protein kinase
MTEQSSQDQQFDTASESETAAEVLLERLRGATRGDYDIFGELGRGGMATVYLAHELSLDRKVAIKVMSPAMIHGAGMVERFKREARTAANLSHPNIIPIYAVREVDGLLFCVIKLVQGTPLDTIMAQLHELPVAMVQAILAQVGDALGYAHRQGVVHRDIKPGNILIDDEGWAVVTDFGIAKVMESDGLTMTGMAVGTPTYMSPEQASSDNVTGASDQYSLGVVAYEMLAGRPPFTGKSTMALMYSHFHEEPEDIGVHRPDCPPQLRDAIMRMLKKDPAERWPSLEVAVAAMGARQLSHDDPTRSQLIQLARTSSTHRIVAQVQTPRSPIPLTRLRQVTNPPAPAPLWTRRPLLLGLGAIALVGAGYLLARLAAPAAPVAGAIGAAPDSSGTAGMAEPTAVVQAPAQQASVPPASVPEVPRETTRPVVGSGGGAATERRPATGQTTPAPAATASGAGAGSISADTTTPATMPSAGRGQPADSALLPRVPAPQTQAVPPSVAAPPSSLAAPPTTARTVTPEAEVTAAILAYGRAIADADLAAARRLYPGMPDEQRQGLEALWSAGGSMTPRWTVTDIAVAGNTATARVTGTNVVTTQRGPDSVVPVSLRARLERRGTEWRLLALVN